MLGLGFWELVVIGVIALIVLGPEDLPKAARTVARWLNALKRETDQVAQEVKKLTEDLPTHQVKFSREVLPSSAEVSLKPNSESEPASGPSTDSPPPADPDR